LHYKLLWDGNVIGCVLSTTNALTKRLGGHIALFLTNQNVDHRERRYDDAVATWFDRVSFRQGQKA